MGDVKNGAGETVVCIGHDPFCPCQDGDACHYVDLPGSDAMTTSSEAQHYRRAIEAALKLLTNPYDGGEFEDGEMPVVDVLRSAMRGVEA